MAHVPSAGGWQYSVIDATVVDEVREHIIHQGKVHWSEDNDKREGTSLESSQSICNARGKDKSCHPIAKPLLVVFPANEGMFHPFSFVDWLSVFLLSPVFLMSECMSLSLPLFSSLDILQYHLHANDWTEEVVALVQFCNDRKIPIVTRGAGTGLEGGCIPYQGGIVCDTSHLNRISVDPENMLARVGAGVLKDQLNKYLEPHGFFFGPDPSSNPSLGSFL